MVLRTGKYGEFYGCSAYPKCKGIVKVNGHKKEYTPKVTQANVQLRKIKNLSHYQSAIENWIRTDINNAMVCACAGSGKTSTLEHIIAIIKELKPDAEIIYLVFNTHVKNSALERGLPAQTTHSLGFSTIQNYLRSQGKKAEVREHKVKDIVKNIIQFSWDEDKYLINPVCDVVSKLKNTMLEPTIENIEILCDRFGIEVNNSFNRIAELSIEALKKSDKLLTIVDFDDQLRLPVIHNMPVKQYDYVMGDEQQDMNRAQILLVLKTLKQNGRACLVGDNFQSIYSFRGADIHAMERLETAFRAIRLPLSISYRCPASHVRLVNSLFPEIPFELNPNAKEGSIENMSYDKMLGSLKDGHLVLCRTNAPLVEPCFSLIRQGVKAIIRGRDIGKSLVNLIEKFQTEKVIDLITLITEYERKEVAKLTQAEKNNQASTLQDKVQTIIALSDGCEFTYQVIQKTEEVFSDKNDGVIFSTVHRAKGDEAETVYILYPQYMPHKLATKEHELSQERNIAYVALTRSKDRMIFVGGGIGYQPQLIEEKNEENIIPDNNTIDAQPTTEEIKSEIVIPAIPSCPF
jgi:DNA helicase-2/ATP-dependent DNA helicase PcrA